MPAGIGYQNTVRSGRLPLAGSPGQVDNDRVGETLGTIAGNALAARIRNSGNEEANAALIRSRNSTADLNEAKTAREKFALKLDQEGAVGAQLVATGQVSDEIGRQFAGKAFAVATDDARVRASELQQSGASDAEIFEVLLDSAPEQEQVKIASALKKIGMGKIAYSAGGTQDPTKVGAALRLQGSQDPGLGEAEALRLNLGAGGGAVGINQGLTAPGLEARRGQVDTLERRGQDLRKQATLGAAAIRAGGDVSASKAKDLREIQSLLRQGYSQNEAENIVYGRIEVRTDPTTKRAVRTNILDSTAVPLTEPQRVPTDQRQAAEQRLGDVLPLETDVQDAVGVGPTLKAGANAIMSAVPFADTPFPEVTKPRQRVAATAKSLEQLFVNNPKFPVAEMARVRQFIPQIDDVFTTGDITTGQIEELRDIAKDREASLMLELDSNITSKREGEILDTLSTWRSVMRELGPDPRAQGLGAATAPAQTTRPIPAGDSGYPEGTVIENAAGEQMVLRNGQWEPM